MVWSRVLDNLDNNSLPPQHRAWLPQTRPLGLIEDTALLAAPNEFAKEILETRLRTVISQALSAELGREIRVAVTVDPSAVPPSAPTEEASSTSSPDSSHPAPDQGSASYSGPRDTARQQAWSQQPVLPDPQPTAPQFTPSGRPGPLPGEPFSRGPDLLSSGWNPSSADPGSPASPAPVAESDTGPRYQSWDTSAPHWDQPNRWETPRPWEGGPHPGAGNRPHDVGGDSGVPSAEQPPVTPPLSVTERGDGSTNPTS